MNKDSWYVGIGLIVIGILFLLYNTNRLFYLENWWALFILIPALSSFADAWNKYQKNNKTFNRKVGDSLFGGFLLLYVTFIFLFDLDWSKVWPGFLIIIGLIMLLENLGSNKQDNTIKEAKQ